MYSTISYCVGWFVHPLTPHTDKKLEKKYMNNGGIKILVPLCGWIREVKNKERQYKYSSSVASLILVIKAGNVCIYIYLEQRGES